MTKIYLVIVCATWFCVFESGLCLDCHQCDAYSSEGCNDPYDSMDKKELPYSPDDNIDGCEDKDTHCLKIKIVQRLQDAGAILGKPTETAVTSRGCIRADGQGDGCKYIQSASGFMFKCLCSTDNCNSGRGIVGSLVLMGVALVTTLTSHWLL